MSRTYRGIINNSQDEINDVVSIILGKVTEIHRIATTIRDEDVCEETIEKIEDIEYIAGSLIHELE